MASKSFDFGKMKRSFLTTKLKNGKTLIINMPMKRTFEKMNDMQELEDDSLAYGAIVDLVAEILSNNKNKIPVSKEEIENDYDLEEMVEFIKTYGEFASSLSNDPN